MNYFDNILVTYTSEQVSDLLLTQFYDKIVEMNLANKTRFIPLLCELVESEDCQKNINHPTTQLILGNKNKTYHVLLTYALTQDRAEDIDGKVRSFQSLIKGDFFKREKAKKLRDSVYLIRFMVKYKVRYKQDPHINFRDIEDDMVLLEIFINI